MQEVQNIFYYDRENSTLMSLDINKVSLESNTQLLQSQGNKRTVVDSSKRNPERDYSELSNKRQKPNVAATDSKLSLAMKTLTNNTAMEKDSSIAFGNFVVEELRNIKDHEQMQLVRLRIHQILFDDARRLLKMPTPKL